MQWSGALMVHQSHEIFTLLFRELCIMKLRPRLYMGLSSISSVMIISTQYSIHWSSCLMNLRMKPCCSISSRIPNIRTIIQWTIEHTTPLPSVAFYTFSMLSCHICLGQIEICAGSLRCLRNLRNLVSAQADSKFAQVCVSPRYGYNNTIIYICIESCTTYSNFWIFTTSTAWANM